MAIDEHPVTEPASAPHGRLGMRFAIIFTALVAAALLVAALSLGSWGTSRRTLASGQTATVTSSAELLAAFDSLGAHGVAVLAATEDLGYTPVEIATPQVALQWPVAPSDLKTYFRESIARSSWSWVLVRTGAARSLDYVLPSRHFKARVEEGREKGFPGIAPDGSSIRANDEGFVRTISDRVGSQGSPLVLVVDASYFRTGTAEELMAALKRAGVRPDAVVINTATDATDVDDAARAALEQAAPELEALVSR